MARKQHLEVLATGVLAWNQWRDEHRRGRPDLRGADLRGADLRGYNLRGANLSGVDLSSADLGEANLSGAVVQGANLTGTGFVKANLTSVDFSGMDLAGVWFHEADCMWASFRGANLDHTEFLDAMLMWADFSTSTMPYAAFNNAVCSEAKLNGATFFDTDFAGVEFRDAELVGVVGPRSGFAGARFQHARMAGADLRRGDFTGAHLTDVDLSAAILTGATFVEANLTRARLTDADLRSTDLSGAILVHAQIGGADLSGARVYGIAAWDLIATGAVQHDLIITAPDQPTVRVDDIEVAQFVYLLLNHRKLRTVLNTVAERGVLLLGRFGDGGLELMHAIAAVLRELEYLPIIFDFERPDSRNYTETVKVLAGLSRFIIAELSGPSVPQELAATVPFFKIPVVPILGPGCSAYSMFADLLEYPWVLPPVRFNDHDDLVGQLPTAVIAPAEAKHAERQARLDELFSG